LKFPGAQQLGVSSPQFQTAERACQHLLPTGIDDQFPPAEAHLLLNGMLRFSQCMRHHGLRNWPDPITDSQGRPEFPLSTVPGTDERRHEPRVTHIENECQHLLPGALGGIPIG
jgi:hypothetical protein